MGFSGERLGGEVQTVQCRKGGGGDHILNFFAVAPECRERGSAFKNIFRSSIFKGARRTDGVLYLRREVTVSYVQMFLS